MKISCKCLNVIVECKGSTIDEIDILTFDIPKHDFFNEGVGTVELDKICKEQPVLVEVQSLGSWVIHRCLNCQMYTHALNRDKGAASLLVNKSLVTDPAVITELKSSENYSQTYNIVINHTEDDDDVFPKVSGAGRHQASVSSLHQVLASYIQRESAQTEERVRSYTDQQYTALEVLRSRAHQDHQHLIKILNDAGFDSNNATRVTNASSITKSGSTFGSSDSNKNRSAFTDVTNKNVASGQPNVASPVVLASASEAIQAPSVVLANKSKSTAQSNNGAGFSSSNTISHKLLETGSQGNLSFDSEVLFPLEGMEDPASDNYHTDEERSDTDDSGSHDEGIHIPRRVNSLVYAKSLPVNVPNFMRPQLSDVNTLTMAPEEPYEPTLDPLSEHRRSPRQPMDIAASIKALAKSVHGDTVFGDLPRPRFSSKI